MTKTAFCGRAAHGGTSHITKTLLVMKLTVFLITAACLHVAAKGISQDVTFSGKNVSLEKVFVAIEKQTGYAVLYSKAKLEGSKPVTVRVSNMPLTEFLDIIFANQDLKYSIEAQTIIVSPRPTVGVYTDRHGNIPVTGILDVQFLPIHGRVVDAEGKPLHGASVIVNGSKVSTATDANGNFTINAEAGNTLIISFVGYQPKEYIISPADIAADRQSSITIGDKNRSIPSITISLRPTDSKLDEVQLIAYGTRSKRFNTGNVTTIKSKDIEDIPVSNPLLALDGRVPGMEIKPSSGIPGAGVTVRIHGVNSLQSGNDPLIVVDNVPYPSQSVSSKGSDNLNNEISGILGSSGGANSGQLGSPLSFINTPDIESIDILKGADATSIYGSRAANGAILITTKKGKSGKMSVSLGLQSGLKFVGKKLEILNAKQYLELRREALANDGLTVGPYDYDLNGRLDTSLSHDWQKELLKRSALNTLSSVSISGGNDNTTYLLSGTYAKEDHIYVQPFNSNYNTRAAIHSNISASTPNKKLAMQFTTDYMMSTNKLPTADFMRMAITRLMPIGPHLFTANGNINWQVNEAGQETFGNPLAENLKTYERKANNLIANLNLSYQVLPGLKLVGNMGYNKLQSDDIGTTPTDAIPPTMRMWFYNTLYLQNTSSTTWNVEPAITYNKSFNKTTIDAFLGSTLTYNEQDFKGFQGMDFSSDELINDIGSARVIYNINVSNNMIYRYEAVSSRINIMHDKKYILQASARRDGSSRFGPENRFHTFYSIAGAWLFSEELFMRDKFKWLSFAKLRGSYGTSGNDQIGDYSFLTLYSAQPAIRSYQGILGVFPTRLTNRYLQWEGIRKMEVALETGLFKERVLLTANFSRNRSSNQLVELGLPSVAGYTNILLNLPAVIQNKVWEFTLNTSNIRKANFSWSTLFTLTQRNNKLVSFEGLKGTPYENAFLVGESLSAGKKYRAAGVNEQTGIYDFYDHKGNLVSDPDPVLDANVIINTDPKYTGGFGNNIKFKDFTFNIFFVFSRGYVAMPYVTEAGAYGATVPTYYLNRWRKPGDKTEYPRATSGYQYLGNFFNYAYSSDKAFLDQYVIRCSNMSLGWELPRQWKKAMGMAVCNLYTQIMNPFLITNNKKSLDPETGFSLPQLKTFNLGLKVTF